MKYLKYLLIAIIGLFAAGCAEEDPMSLGVLNPKVTVSQITATTAVISVDLSDCAELIPDGDCTCCVYTNAISHFWDRSFTIRSKNNPETLHLSEILTLEDLDPSTTYQFCIGISSVFGEWQPIFFTSPDYTFTTAQ